MNVSIFSMLLKFCSLVTDFFTLYQLTNQQAKRKKKRKKEKKELHEFIYLLMFEIVSEKPGTDFRGHINDLHQLHLQK